MQQQPERNPNSWQVDRHENSRESFQNRDPRSPINGVREQRPQDFAHEDRNDRRGEERNNGRDFPRETRGYEERNDHRGDEHFERRGELDRREYADHDRREYFERGGRREVIVHEMGIGIPMAVGVVAAPLIIREVQQSGIVIPPPPTVYIHQPPPASVQRQTEEFRSVVGSSSGSASHEAVIETTEKRDGYFHRIWVWIVMQWNSFMTLLHINSSSAVVERLSYCSAITMGQANFMRQIGDNGSSADSLDRGAYAYAKTAFEIGKKSGMTRARIIEINEDNSRKVYKEILNQDFFNGDDLRKKNDDCLALVKSDLDILQVWRRYY